MSAPRKLRISYLIQQFPVPTETFAISDIASLVAQGHSVTVYTMKPPRRRHLIPPQSAGIPANLPVFRPTMSGALWWPKIVWRWRWEVGWLCRRIFSNVRSAPGTALQAMLCIPRLAEIADHVARHDCDVVHAFWSRHVGLALPLLKKRNARPLRTAFVGAYDLVANDFILDLTTRAADVLFSHAEVNRAFLERKAPFGTPIAIIHRGIPLMQSSSNEPRDPYRLITASALVESKNVEAVIRSFAEARSRDRRLTLDVYGEGPDRLRLEKLAQSLHCSTAITFGGHIARDMLFDQMQHASIFLLLSKKPSERLPNVLKEALWAGCAVISSNSEGIAELIPDSSFGHVVQPDDLQAVTAALSAVLSESPAQSDARRQKAREFIAANFSSDASMRHYVEAWLNKIQPAHEVPPT